MFCFVERYLSCCYKPVFAEDRLRDTRPVHSFGERRILYVRNGLAVLQKYIGRHKRGMDGTLFHGGLEPYQRDSSRLRTAMLGSRGLQIRRRVLCDNHIQFFGKRRLGRHAQVRRQRNGHSSRRNSGRSVYALVRRSDNP